MKSADNLNQWEPKVRFIASVTDDMIKEWAYTFEAFKFGIGCTLLSAR